MTRNPTTNHAANWAAYVFKGTEWPQIQKP